MRHRDPCARVIGACQIDNLCIAIAIREEHPRFAVVWIILPHAFDVHTLRCNRRTRSAIQIASEKHELYDKTARDFHKEPRGRTEPERDSHSLPFIFELNLSIAASMRFIGTPITAT